MSYHFFSIYYISSNLHSHLLLLNPISVITVSILQTEKKKKNTQELKRQVLAQTLQCVGVSSRINPGRDTCSTFSLNQ